MSTELNAHALERLRKDDRIVDWFLDNACPDHHVRSASAHKRAHATALRILARHPDVAHHDLYTQVVCGDLNAVTSSLAANPAIAAARNGVASAKRSGSAGDDWLLELGPKGWEPLLYLAFTRLSLAESVNNAEAIATALLRAGADPNVFFMAGGSQYTPLVGVIGEGEENRPPHPRRDALVRILLDAGANPFDRQVLYNIHFHGDVLWFFTLIYEHSHLTQAAAWADPEWKMLSLGGYGDGAFFFLHLAIKHSKPELAEWCLAHGANPNAGPPPKDRGGRASLYERAVRAGEAEIAALLLRAGAVPADVTLGAAEQLTVASMRMDREAVAEMFRHNPDLRLSPDALFVAARKNRTDVVGMLLELGMSAEVEDGSGQRALHVAAYHNALDVARLLLARGVHVDPINRDYDGTPLGGANWAQHSGMVDLLSQHSTDLWELNFIGRIERVRELLRDKPELARHVTGRQETLLMWLPQADEERAIELAELLMQHGADPTVVNSDGQSASDRAERLGMMRLAGVLRGGPGSFASAGPQAFKPVRVRRSSDHLDELTTRDWNAVFERLEAVPNAELHASGVMTDAIAKRLAQSRNLVSVVAMGSHELTDAGVRALASITGLRKLDVSGTPVTDAVLPAIGAMEALEDLSLSMTYVTDSGIKSLAQCTTLETVNCLWTDTSDELIRSVARAPNLTGLFTGNGVTGAGLALLHGIRAFVEPIAFDGSFPFFSTQHGPNHLTLRGTFTDDDMRNLRGLDGLFGLNIAEVNLPITSRALVPLIQLAGLQRLSCEATNESMTHIAAMPALRFLSCQDTEADDDGFIALSRSQTLEYIWGRRCHNLRHDGFVALSTMPALLGLSVSCKNVDDAAIATLPEFPALRELMPMDIPDAGYRHIGQCSDLEALLLMYCRDTTDAATGQITGLALKKYFASYTRITDRTPELLSTMESLEDVTFDGCAGLTNAGVAALARLPALGALHLSGNQLSEDVVKVFGPQVRVRYSL